MTTTFRVEQGDVVVSASSGQPTMIADGRKLRQDLAEMMSTQVQPDNIGAGLENIIDGSAVDRFDVQFRLSDSIGRATEVMKSLQRRIQRTERPPSEQLVSLVSIFVGPVVGSLTAYAFRAEFTTNANTRTSVSGVIS